MPRIVVAGDALPGLAAAARLAKVGHEVTLLAPGPALGGRLARPGVLPPVWVFPAPLRDLLRKSGRTLGAEFGRRGLRLATAPPARHVFDDGATLDWPAGRGEQWHLLAERYGTAVATRWRDLLDEHDETWQLLRPLGLEGELTSRLQVRSRHRALHPRLTVEEAARRLDHPHLSELVRDVARRIGSEPAATPAWLLTRLSVERTFGRWAILDAAGTPQPGAVLLEVLADRLATRGVRVELGVTPTQVRADAVGTAAELWRGDAVVSTLDPWAHVAAAGGSLAARAAVARLRPALAPVVSVRIETDTGAGAEPGPQEEVRHTPSGPVVTYRRRLPGGGAEAVVHDFTRRSPDPAFGAAWAGPATWLRLPALRTPGRPRLLVASASSRGGNEPWAQLLTGALATYAAHHLLTGEDIRPTNRGYRP